jgi:Anthrone oxygenase
MEALPILQIIALVLIAVGLSLSLSHALELPGKLRLGRDAYVAVQSIYYPGFTVGGIFGEPGAMLATFVALIFTQRGSPAFSFTLSAFAALVLMHAVFWIVTQPVNRVWLADQDLGRAGAAFFRTDGGGSTEQDWTRVRNRWEYSHVARAGCAFVAFVAMAVAIAL